MTERGRSELGFFGHVVVLAMLSLAVPLYLLGYALEWLPGRKRRCPCCARWKYCRREGKRG